MADCPITFTDVAEAAGLRFTHDRGSAGQFRFPEMIGSGVAWLDYDNDGWLDLYVVQSGPFPPSRSPKARDRLFRNRGDGPFADVTERAGLRDTAYGMGAIAADYDKDGFVDIYVTNWGGNMLLRNAGDGTFTDVSTKAGIAGPRWGTSAAWGDATAMGGSTSSWVSTPTTARTRTSSAATRPPASATTARPSCTTRPSASSTATSATERFATSPARRGSPPRRARLSGFSSPTSTWTAGRTSTSPTTRS